ncbi:MAG: PIG-L deacetylase family protein [Chloroflexota bacterium]
MSEYIPEKALFIAAHPDDLEFGVAGTAAKWAAAGSEVTFCLITDGNAGTHEEGMTAEKLAEIRREEQLEAAKILGVKNVEFLGYDDCKLVNTLELREKLVRLIRKYQPNILGCQDPTNVFPRSDYINHPDHRAAGGAAIDAAFPSSEMPLLYPNIDAEGYPPHKANYVYVFFTTDDKVNQYVDISDHIDTKIESLRAHKSQMGDWDPEPRIKEWAAGSGKQVGFSYAERYFRITLKEPDKPEVGVGKKKVESDK